MKKSHEERLTQAQIARREVFKYAGLGVGAAAVGVSGIAGAAAIGTAQDGTAKKSIAVLVDFPDTDYGEVIMRNVDRFEGLGAELLMRYAAYVDHEEQIPRGFTRVHPHEQRAEVISHSAVVITPCIKTVIASIKAGAVPVYVRHDHAPHGVEEELGELGVRVVSLDQQDSLAQALGSIPV